MKIQITILALCLFSLKIFSQGYQPKSVTISPEQSNIQDIQGNVKATGIIQGSTLKAAGLATGDPYVIRPIYANVDGQLVTGYRLFYFSIPASAFRLSEIVNIEDTNDPVNFRPSGNDYLQYNGRNITFFNLSSNRLLLAPIQVPHKSFLTSMKISFSTYFDSKALYVSIVRSNLLHVNDETILYSFTTAITGTTQLVTEEIFPEAIEIDNQNYLYTLKVSSSINKWNGMYFRGAIIEYRDL